MSGRLAFDDKANKAYIYNDWLRTFVKHGGKLKKLKRNLYEMPRLPKKPTRLCCTPDKPKCEECEHGDT